MLTLALEVIVNSVVIIHMLEHNFSVKSISRKISWKWFHGKFKYLVVLPDCSTFTGVILHLTVVESSYPRYSLKRKFVRSKELRKCRGDETCDRGWCCWCWGHRICTFCKEFSPKVTHHEIFRKFLLIQFLTTDRPRNSKS